jgi:hypothetical protein
VAEVAEPLQPRHTRTTFEGVYLALKVLHQFAVGKFVTPGIQQRIATLQDLDSFFEEDGNDASFFNFDPV